MTDSVAYYSIWLLGLVLRPIMAQKRSPMEAIEAGFFSRTVTPRDMATSYPDGFFLHDGSRVSLDSNGGWFVVSQGGLNGDRVEIAHMGSRFGTNTYITAEDGTQIRQNIMFDASAPTNL